MLEKKIIYKSRSWKDLDNTLKKLIQNKKAKLAGSIFEHVTKLFLEVSPEYKTKLKKVYLLNEVPSSLKKKLRLPNTDEGIDLIAETFDKQYWAIQCKYRSNKTETLKIKGDLATFNNLAFTVCKNISHGIVCATVNRPPKKQNLVNVGYILLTEWMSLDRNNGELFDQIKSKSVGKIKKPIKKTPRPHQSKAVNKTLSYFNNNKRGKIIMPCGTGKSLTAFWIAKKMKCKLILIAMPSLALLQQTLKVWTREFLLHNIKPDWLCVCSDDTVKEEQDEFVTFSADLGIKVDTDPRVIKRFLNKKNNKIKIVFTTYQSGRATSIGSKGFTYDLGIMDEAHKTVGSVKKPMAYLLHQKNIKINNRLFMTATERLFRGNSDEYMSMDDSNDYGKIIYELSFKEAINSKPPIISDYKILTLNIKNSEIEKLTKSNKYLEIKKELNDITARELLTTIALRKAIKKLKIKNTISFHRSKRRAFKFKEQQKIISKIYPFYGKLNTFHVTGDMPTSNRSLEMLSFEENNGLITNARCLTEGVDLPAVDCVCFADPKRSKIDIVQAAGRALRLSKGKKYGYILIPIFIPDKTDFIDAAKDQGYEEITLTVRALDQTDTRISEYLKAISEGKRPITGSPVDGLVSLNNPYKIKAEKFNRALQLKIWDKIAITRKRSYQEAHQYALSQKLNTYEEWLEHTKNKNFPKDIPIYPDGLKKDGTKFYKEWVSWPKFLRNLTEKEEFLEFIEQYKSYSQKNPYDKFPPELYITKKGYGLGQKAKGLVQSNKRKEIKLWKKLIVEKELVKNNLFDWEGKNTYLWKNQYKILEQCIDKKLIIGRGSKIWWTKQKKDLKNKKLEKWQIKTLKNIDKKIQQNNHSKILSLFTNKKENEKTNWIKNFEKFIDISKKNNGKIPKNLKQTTRWISKQRSKKKDGKLRKEFEEELNKCKYWIWSPFNLKMEKNLILFEEFVKIKKNPNPSQDTVYKRFKIGNWLSKIRLRNSNNKLEKKIYNKLINLGVNFEATKKKGFVKFYN